MSYASNLRCCWVVKFLLTGSLFWKRWFLPPLPLQTLMFTLRFWMTRTMHESSGRQAEDERNVPGGMTYRLIKYRRKTKRDMRKAINVKANTTKNRPVPRNLVSCFCQPIATRHQITSAFMRGCILPPAHSHTYPLKKCTQSTCLYWLAVVSSNYSNKRMLLGIDGEQRQYLHFNYTLKVVTHVDIISNSEYPFEIPRIPENYGSEQEIPVKCRLSARITRANDSKTYLCTLILGRVFNRNLDVPLFKYHCVTAAFPSFFWKVPRSLTVSQYLKCLVEKNRPSLA